MQVIVGDNETRLSVRLFSDVAQGKGHVASLDIVSDVYRIAMVCVCVCVYVCVYLT